MERLQSNTHYLAHDLFAQMSAWNVYLKAVLANDSPGRVYVDDPAAPHSGFAVSLDCAYLAGAPDNDAFNSALRDELAATLLAGDRVNPDDPILAVCTDSEEWESTLADLLGYWRWPPLWGQNYYYRFDSLRLDWREKLPAGYTVARLDTALLRQQGDKLPSTIADSIRIGWQDESNFLQNGFGFVALADEEIVCWCLADVTTASACEIGIETEPGHRRRGLATAVTAATVQFCRQQGFSHIGWHCGADNPGSVGTAVNVGFVRERAYTFYEFYYDEARHYAELGRTYFFADMIEEAADALDLTLALDDDPPDYVYLLAARAEAKLGNGHDALELLAAAINAGFHDAALLETLPEFRPLYPQKRWRTLIARLSRGQDSSEQ